MLSAGKFRAAVLGNGLRNADRHTKNEYHDEDRHERAKRADGLMTHEDARGMKGRGSCRIWGNPTQES